LLDVPKPKVRLRELISHSSVASARWGLRHVLAPAEHVVLIPQALSLTKIPDPMNRGHTVPRRIAHALYGKGDADLRLWEMQAKP
jgi:hypothetical protein